jgi:hypothetical protein
MAEFGLGRRERDRGVAQASFVITKEASMPKLLRYGHAPGHVRDTACAAFEAWIAWNGKSPEPTVEYEIKYAPHEIPISKACTLVWNCTDIVPGDLIDRLVGEGLELKSRTYAACARAILADIKSRHKAA